MHKLYKFQGHYENAAGLNKTGKNTRIIRVILRFCELFPFSNLMIDEINFWVKGGKYGFKRANRSNCRNASVFRIHHLDGVLFASKRSGERAKRSGIIQQRFRKLKELFGAMSKIALILKQIFRK
jgi:hypothetical protein